MISCYKELLTYTYPFTVPYTYSAMAQVISAILAITLTFRIILSQRIKYRFPLVIVGKLGLFEKFYFLSGAALVSLSLIFLMINHKGMLPVIVILTLMWIFSLFWYYHKVKMRLSLENLLEMAFQRDTASIEQWKKDSGIVTKEPKLILYDLTIQAANEKDFQFMENTLAHLATLSNKFSHFIVREQIGVICRQYIANSIVFKSCCHIFYRLISPVRAGIWKKQYFFDKKKTPTSFKNFNTYATDVWFSRSSVFTEQNCFQVIMELQELTKTYFCYLLGEDRKFREREIAIIIISALADFLCMKLCNSHTVNNLNFDSPCERKLIKFLNKMSNDRLLEAINEVSSLLNAFMIIATVEAKKSAQKVSAFISSIWCEAAKHLEILLKNNLNEVETRFPGFRGKIKVLQSNCGGRYWIEEPKEIRHNWKCPRFGETKNGYWSGSQIHTQPCKICGG